MVGGIGLTALLVGTIASAVSDIGSPFFIMLVGAVIVAATIIHVLFPGSRLFSIALADLLAVYGCLFVLFGAANFDRVTEPIRLTGFALPILTFLLGCWWRRAAIERVVEAHGVGGERGLIRVLVWLVPVFGIGVLTFFLPWLDLGVDAANIVFLAAMTAISAVVLVVSRDVAAFLIDTGLLFEEFFDRIRHLIVPAFAFLTFYSLVIIVFACLYRIIDAYSPQAHFSIAGVARDITFPEALYFSVVTITTVGYGDVLPLTDIVRALTAIEIIVGILMWLFGFSEIMAYTREQHDRRQHGDRRDDPDR